MGLLRRRVKPYEPGFLLLVNCAQHKAVKENPQSLAGMRPWRLTGVHGVGLSRCKCSHPGPKGPGSEVTEHSKESHRPDTAWLREQVGVYPGKGMSDV